MNQKRLEIEQVEFMPKEFTDGILYISERFDLAIHLCACGCKKQTVTPIGDGGWNLSVNENNATLTPSIGNSQMECKSHYWISNGEIVWC